MTDFIPPYHYVGVETALEFVDTIETEKGIPVDRFTSTAAAIDWLREHGLLHEPVEAEVEALRLPGPASDRALAQIRRVREALREIVTASVEGRPATGRAIDTVNRVMLARQRFILVCGPKGVLDHRHEGDAIEDVLARLAERIARQVISPDADRLRICASDTCDWVFYDTSPTGRRRWCDMNTCGNRAKAARHRARTRGVTVAGTEAAGA
ncbi:MAG TPA: CGNR zinc finger domain-containing protein [Candidatus Limnocylindrales bacterium]